MISGTFLINTLHITVSLFVLIHIHLYFFLFQKDIFKSVRHNFRSSLHV